MHSRTLIAFPSAPSSFKASHHLTTIFLFTSVRISRKPTIQSHRLVIRCINPSALNLQVINSDPNVFTALENFYGSLENVVVHFITFGLEQKSSPVLAIFLSIKIIQLSVVKVKALAINLGKIRLSLAACNSRRSGKSTKIYQISTEKKFISLCLTL